MIYTLMTKMALKLCFEAHQDAVDRGGTPYAFHPYHIAEKMKDENAVCVALMHDILEETDCTPEQLFSMGFNEEIIGALKALTREKDESYKKYISRVSENELAKKVKIADLLHNSDITRITDPTQKDIERCEKYRRAIEYLVLG